MNRPKNFRVYFLLAVLAIGGIVLLLREHRPSFLRPDLHLSAYVTTADGNVTVVDPECASILPAPRFSA